MPTEERQLAAIMFTDMVGYSAMANGTKPNQAFSHCKSNNRVTFLGSLG